MHALALAELEYKDGNVSLPCSFGETNKAPSVGDRERALDGDHSVTDSVSSHIDDLKRCFEAKSLIHAYAAPSKQATLLGCVHDGYRSQLAMPTSSPLLETAKLHEQQTAFMTIHKSLKLGLEDARNQHYFSGVMLSIIFCPRSSTDQEARSQIGLTFSMMPRMELLHRAAIVITSHKKESVGLVIFIPAITGFCNYQLFGLWTFTLAWYTNHTQCWNAPGQLTVPQSRAVYTLVALTEHSLFSTPGADFEFPNGHYTSLNWHIGAETVLQYNDVNATLTPAAGRTQAKFNSGGSRTAAYALYFLMGGEATQDLLYQQRLRYLHEHWGITIHHPQQHNPQLWPSTVKLQKDAAHDFAQLPKELVSNHFQTGHDQLRVEFQQGWVSNQPRPRGRFQGSSMQRPTATYQWRHVVENPLTAYFQAASSATYEYDLILSQTPSNVTATVDLTEPSLDLWFSPDDPDSDDTQSEDDLAGAAEMLRQSKGYMGASPVHTSQGSDTSRLQHVAEGKHSRHVTHWEPLMPLKKLRKAESSNWITFSAEETKLEITGSDQLDDHHFQQKVVTTEELIECSISAWSEGRNTSGWLGRGTLKFAVKGKYQGLDAAFIQLNDAKSSGSREVYAELLSLVRGIGVASYWAESFHKTMAILETNGDIDFTDFMGFQFAPLVLLQVKESKGWWQKNAKFILSDWILVAPLIKPLSRGKLLKVSGTDGVVVPQWRDKPQPIPPLVRTLDAFQHFVYHKSGQKLLLSDLQGWLQKTCITVDHAEIEMDGFVLIDPEVHRQGPKDLVH
ncbi:hypothetical protein DL93DRAFT_2206133 [Clavulina sp. PMI_390]|nr:hypothetical protein DL93DRAFT_2206133 [Clavulina sp. PMI_390]